VHKPLFPMNITEYIGSLVVYFILILANSGGLGGGGVITPVALIFFGFDPKNAIPLSNASIFFAAIIRYFYNFDKRNTKKGFGVLVNYDYGILMLPAIVVGSALGVVIFVILPELIIIIALTLLLLCLFILTSLKWYKVH
jgi:uncharacterized membrane protein YfcA